MSRLRNFAASAPLVRELLRPTVAHAHTIPAYRVNAFRFRTVDPTSTAANAAFNASDPALNAGAALSADAATAFRLRFEVEETNGAGSNETLTLWVSRNGGAFQQVTAASTVVRARDNTVYADDTATTNLIAGSARTFLAGFATDTDATAPTSGNLSWAGNQHTEIDFCVELVPADLTNGDTLDFEIRGGSAITQPATRPRVTVSKTSGQQYNEQGRQVTVSFTPQVADSQAMREAATGGVDGLQNSFEGQADETGVTAANLANSGDAPTEVVPNSGTFTYDTARAAHGSVSVRVDTSGSLDNMRFRFDNLGWSKAYGRLYLDLNGGTIAANGQRLQSLFNPSLGAIAHVNINTDRTIRLLDNGNALLGAITTPANASGFFRVEYLVDLSGAWELRLFNTPGSATPTDSVSGSGEDWGSPASIHRVENPNYDNTMPTGWLDGIGLSDVDWLGPYSEGTPTGGPGVTAAFAVTATDALGGNQFDETGRLVTVALTPAATDARGRIRHVATATYSSGNANTTSLAIPIPAGLQEGDLVLVETVTGTGGDPTWSSADLTQVGATQFNGGVGSALWRRVATAADEAAAGSGTWTVTSVDSNRQAAVVVVYRGVDPTTPLEDTEVSNDPGAGGMVLAPTTVTDRARVVFLLSKDGSFATSRWFVASGSAIQRYSDQLTDTLLTLGAFDATVETAGTRSVTFDLPADENSTNNAIGFAVALKPAPTTNQYDETGRQVTLALTPQAQDSFAGADSLAATVVVTPAAQDSLAATESLALAAVLLPQATDALSLTEQLEATAVLLLQAQDALSGADALSVTAVLVPVTSTQLSASDLALVTVTLTPTALDVREATEAGAVTVTATVAVADQLSLSEAVAVTGVLVPQAQDLLHAQEPAQVVAVFVLDGTDQLSGAQNYDETGRQVTVTVLAQGADSLVALDQAQVTAVVVPLSQDQASLTDALGVTVAVTPDVAAVTRSQEGASATVSFTVTLSDLLAGIESAVVAAVVTPEAQDQATLADSPQVLVEFVLDGTDSLSGADSFDERNRLMVLSVQTQATDDWTGREPAQATVLVTVEETDRGDLTSHSSVTVEVTPQATSALVTGDELNVVLSLVPQAQDARRVAEAVDVLATLATAVLDALGLQETRLVALQVTVLGTETATFADTRQVVVTFVLTRTDFSSADDVLVIALLLVGAPVGHLWAGEDEVRILVGAPLDSVEVSL